MVKTPLFGEKLFYFSLKLNFLPKKFGGFKKSSYLCIAFERKCITCFCLLYTSDAADD